MLFRGEEWHPGILLTAHYLKKLPPLPEDCADWIDSFLNHVPDVVYCVDLRTGRFLFLSPSVKQFSGYRPCVFYEDPAALLSIIHPDSRLSFKRQRAGLRLGKKPETITIRIIHKDGTPRSLSLRNIYLYDNTGKPCAITGLGADCFEHDRLKKAFSESAALKTVILDNLSEAVLYYSAPDHRVKWANRAGRLTSEHGGRELYRRRCYEVWQGRDSPCPRCPVKDCFKTGRPCQAEIFREDGRLFWVRAIPLCESDGRVSGVVEIASELTQMHQAFAELGREAELRKTMIDNAMEGIFIFQRGTRRPRTLITAWNHKMTAITGRSLKSANALGWSGLFQQDEKGMKMVRRYLSHVANRQDIPALEFEFTRPDNTLAFVRFYARLTGLEEGVPHYIGFLQDLTAERETHLELQSSLDLYQALVKTSPDAVIVTDRKAVITNASQRAVWTFGAKAVESLMGRGAITLLDPRERDRIDKLMRLVTRQGFAERREFLFRRLDGSVFTGELNLSLLRDQAGNPRNFIAITRDITERKRTEAALTEHRERLEELVRKRTAELEAFTYSVTHDLKAPLRAMQGFADALSEDYRDVLDGTGQNYLGRISDAAGRMEKLINEMLNYSRLSYATIRVRRINLASVFRTVLTELTPAVRASNAVLELPPDLPEVQGDFTLLMQIVENLLSNALKFVAPGKTPRIRVLLRRRKGFIRLTVKDNGIGIAEKDKEIIFQMFERLHGIETYPGTGVGLAMVKKAAERLDAKIGFTSVTGKGTAFWVDLKSVD